MNTPEEVIKKGFLQRAISIKGRPIRISILLILLSVVCICSCCAIIIATPSPETTPTPVALIKTEKPIINTETLKMVITETQQPTETLQPTETETQQPQATATKEVPSRCVPATKEQIDAVRSGIKDIDKNNDVKTGWAVKSNDFNNAWMVSAKVYGAGIEKGIAGAWVMNGDPNNPVLVYSVDGIAKQFSVWPDGSKTDAGFSISDDGVEDAKKCANAE